jgi:endonuclease YncB( thermonuclease family)
VGYDAPERRKRRSGYVSENHAEWGRLAAAHLEKALEAARSIRIKPVIFGRWYTPHRNRLARLIIDGKDVAKVMIDGGMAVAVQFRDGRIVRAKWDKMD